MNKDLKILLLEDSKADAEMIQRLLDNEKMNCEFCLVMNKSAFVKALDSFSPDIILSDHALPQFNSSKALEIARQKYPQLPFILVTGAASEEFAANIIKLGADDYILKDRIARLPAAIKTAMKQRRIEKDHREVLEKIKENEEKYRTLVERVSDGFIALDLKWNFIFLNKKAEELYNRPPGYLTGKNIWTEFPESVDKVFYHAYHQAAKTQQHTYLTAYSFATKKWIEANIYPSATGFSIFFRDISEQIKAENKARKSEEKYGTIMERISDGFVALDKNWNYTYINKKGGEILNRNPEELIGKNMWIEFPEGVNQTFYKAYHKAMKNQKFIQLEEYFAPFDVWLENHIYPSKDGLSIFFRDITERKKSEQLLKESEEKYRTIFFKSPLPIWIFNQKTLQFLEVNNAAIRHYGYSREEFLSMTLTDIRPPEDVPALLKDISKIKNSSTTAHGIWRHLKKNGEVIIVESTAHHIDYNDMKVRMVITNDITKKIKAEEELRQSETRLIEAQALSKIGNWEIDLLQNTHYWSDELYKIFGIKKNGTAPNIDLFISFFHADDRAIAKKIINEALKNYQASKIKFPFIRKDGKQRFAHIEWKFEFNAKGKAIRLYGILQDITEVKQAEDTLKALENKIHAQKIEEQKKIARAIIKGQEKERNFIAKELHDNINQILAGSKMYLSIAGKKSEQLKSLITYPMELIDMSIEEIRILSKRLVSPLKDINLEALIDNLLSEIKKIMSVNTEFVYDVPDELLADELKLNLYRIIQEQTNNIQKYAAANYISITVRTENKVLTLTIQDDGIGFNVKAKRKGIGISNIINRTESFNGSVTIESAPGKGCSIFVVIPC